MRPSLLRAVPLVLLLACTGSGADDADGDGVPASRDCDDQDASIGAPEPETCDGIDQDCNGVIDDNAADATSWFRDLDDDSYGAPTPTPVRGCEPPDPTGWVSRAEDCNDSFDTVYPGAEERCDGQDNDCDGTTDEDPVDPATFYADKDEDGWGDPADTQLGCAPADGYIGRPGDCDDFSASINPEAIEVCNQIDDDCNDLIDDEVPGAPTWLLDSDGDGYAAEGAPSVQACAMPEGYVADAGDCDDFDTARAPGLSEICDGKDNDCDATTSEDGLVALDGVAASDLESAVASAVDGSTVAICEGTWTANLDIEADISLDGEGEADAIVLSPAADGPILTVGSGVVLTVNELSFADGVATRGGAIDAAEAASVTVRDCTFESNLAEDGGAIYAGSASTVEITDSAFTDNVATGDGGALYGSVLMIERTTFSANAADRGGAIALDGGDATFDLLTLFSDNDAGSAGGAIAVLGSYRVSGGEFDSNTTDGDGGALWLADGGSVLTSDIHDNSADGSGGGVACAGSCRLEAPIVSANAAADGGGVALIGAGDAVLVSTEVTDNLATGDGGGLLVDDSGASLTTDMGTEVTGNEASSGGGAAVRAGSLESTSSDWGAGSTDNSPDDVDVDGASYDAYGSSASFTCSASDGSCS